MSTYAVIIIPLVIGYLLDLVFGDPRKLPHPIVAFGNIIGWCERRFNKGEHKKRNGCLVAILLPLSTLVVGGGIAWGCWALHPVVYYIVASIFVFYGLANHSLIQEGGEVIPDIREARTGSRTQTPVMDRGKGHQSTPPEKDIHRRTGNHG